MNKLFLMILGIMIVSCTPKVNDLATAMPVNANINLTSVNKDRVMVSINPGRFTQDTVVFLIPKTVPGTYSIDNYGQYTEELTAYNYKGEKLSVTKSGQNQWAIYPGKDLDRIVYYVNDTFDTESAVEDPVFSPAGTNIEAGKNFFLNLHMLIGYFEGLDRQPYAITVEKPEGFVASTSLTRSTPENAAENTDHFYASRYFEVTDNPIMYAQPDMERFMVNDIEVILSVYSPNKVYSALSLKKDMETMMQAQKRFLGDLNSTKQYNILLFLSEINETSPQGMGALEHHTSTTVVLPESMPKPMLVETMVDVVSHEFFHIVTPLSIHSEEVHFFNYNYPKMSQHLWMYEGVTEYFAQLFQINQELIPEEEFYKRVYDKIQNSKRYDDSMSFTEMSTNILESPYKENYANVYEKGALISMCIDLIIREQSQGERGILALMKQLASEYGTDTPFQDDELFDKIVSLTYPQVGEFIATYVQGDTPIPYQDFLAKAGLTLTDVVIKTPSYLFKTEQEPFIDAKPDSGEIFVREIPLSTFYTELGLQAGDIITHINGKAYSLDNAQELIMTSFQWQEGSAISVQINRDGAAMTLEGTVAAPMLETEKIIPMENAGEAQLKLREAWLKG